jgi:hypothetical protein
MVVSVFGWMFGWLLKDGWFLKEHEGPLPHLVPHLCARHQGSNKSYIYQKKN